MSKRTHTVGSLSLATVISLGVAATVFVLVAITGALVASRSQANRVAESVVIRPDGTPLIASHPASNYLNQSYRSIDGQPVNVGAEAAWLLETSLPTPTSHGDRWSGAWNSRILGVNDLGQPAGYWYFVYESQFKQRGYFMGFDSRSRLPIGYVGNSGFSQSVPTREEQFTVDDRGIGLWSSGALASSVFIYATVPASLVSQSRLPSTLVYMISGGELLEVNLRDQSVRNLLHANDIVSLAVVTQGAVAPTVAADTTATQPKQWLAVRYADRVDLIDPVGDDPAQVVSYSVPAVHQFAKQRRGQSLMVSLTHDGMLIFRHSTSTMSGESTTGHYTWVEPDGNVSRTEEIRLASGGGAAIGPAWLAVMSPIAGTAFPSYLALMGIPNSQVSLGMANNYAEGLTESLAEGWPALLSTYLASGLAAWLCYRRQQRYAASGTAMWMVFVVVFGFPGLLGYVWSRRWPPLTPCRECGKTTCQDRDRCQLCGSEFVQPSLRGTEVFA